MKKATGAAPPGANKVLSSNLNFFETQPADISIAQTFIEHIPSFYTLDNKSSPIEFLINASQNTYLDLRNTTLYVRVKVVKNDGASLTTEKVTTVNLLLSSLFKECEVIVNGKSLTSETGDHYGLR